MTWASPAGLPRRPSPCSPTRSWKRTAGICGQRRGCRRGTRTPRLVDAYADALGRLRAANSTFETRILGEIDGTDPDALPAVPDGLVGPSDTATCTIDILGGSQEDNREELDTCGAMMMNEGSRYRRLLLHHVHAARRLAQDGYLLQDMRLPAACRTA